MGKMDKTRRNFWIEKRKKNLWEEKLVIHWYWAIPNFHQHFFGNLFWRKIKFGPIWCIFGFFKGTLIGLVVAIGILSLPLCPPLVMIFESDVSLKISKSQKQISKFSFEPKNKRILFCISALASKMSQMKKYNDSLSC